MMQKSRQGKEFYHLFNNIKLFIQNSFNLRRVLYIIIMNWLKLYKIYIHFKYSLLHDGCQVSGWCPEMLKQIFLPTSNRPLALGINKVF